MEEMTPLEKAGIQPLRFVPRFLRNKFILSAVFFAAILLFLDKNDLFTVMARNKELRNLQQSKEYYTRQIATERQELEALKTNPAILEKYARENYLMKKDNEDLFIISEKPVPSNN